MSIEHLVVILGKRLQQDTLTAEGRSRVSALVDFVTRNASPSMAIGFCGGVTKHQTRSESDAMYQYYQHLLTQKGVDPNIVPVLLERESTSTVENIRQLAKELRSAQWIEPEGEVTITFVSNDYHLQRIFEIQSLLDEQGLLLVLKQACLSSGLRVSIPSQLEQHVCVPYPTTSFTGELFLTVEALTTYRVYLEGVVAGSFKHELSRVRAEPFAIAWQAISKARQLLASEQQLYEERGEVLKAVLPALEQCVSQTTADKSVQQIKPWLACLDTNLTMLNRMLDPETDSNTRWWR